MLATSSQRPVSHPRALVHRCRLAIPLLMVVSMATGVTPRAGDARPRLEIPGRIIHVGISPNLLAPGPDPGTFLLGDLDYGWITLRRASDGQVLRSYHSGAATLGLAVAPGAREIFAAQVHGSNVLI